MIINILELNNRRIFNWENLLNIHPFNEDSEI